MKKWILILLMILGLVNVVFCDDNPFVRRDEKVKVSEEKKDLKKDEGKRESRDLSLPPPPPPPLPPSQSSLREQDGKQGSEKDREKAGNERKETGNQGGQRVSLIGRVNGKVIVKCSDSIHVVENQSVICGCFVEWSQVYCSIEDYEKEKKLKEFFRGKK